MGATQERRGEVPELSPRICDKFSKGVDKPGQMKDGGKTEQQQRREKRY